jgi:hypothetical protein
LASPEEFVPLPAEAGILPGETADHGAVDPFPVQGFEEVFRPGQAALSVSVKEAESRVAAEKGTGVPDEVGGKQMRVGVDDHEKRIVQTGKV